MGERNEQNTRKESGGQETRQLWENGGGQFQGRLAEKLKGIKTESTEMTANIQGKLTYFSD